MQSDIRAREAQLRTIAAYEEAPEAAQLVQRGVAELGEGLACSYEQNGSRITVDMPAAMGGEGRAPSPGYFGRAAITSCLAIGIKMAAAREGLYPSRVRVTIEQDWDNRGLLGMDEASPVPSQTRISVEAEGTDDPARLGRVIDRAVAADPWFLAYRDAQRVALSVRIGAPGG